MVLHGQILKNVTPSSMPHSLDSLPPETLLQVLEHVPDLQLLRLQACSRALLDVCRSDAVWAARCRSIWQQHAFNSNTVLEAQLFESGEATGEWWPVWTFIARYAQHLGYWASQLPFDGRLVRCGLMLDPDIEAGAPLSQRFLIAVQQITASNAASPQDVAAIMPPSAFAESEPTPAFTLPLNNISPDRGLSIDVLRIKWEAIPIFAISPLVGPYLVAETGHATAFQAKCPMEVVAKERLTSLDLERSRRGARIAEILSSDLIAFPTHALYRSGAMRQPSELVRQGNELAIRSLTMSWEPKIHHETPSGSRSMSIEEETASARVDRGGVSILHLFSF